MQLFVVHVAFVVAVLDVIDSSYHCTLVSVVMEMPHHCTLVPVVMETAHVHYKPFFEV